MKEQSSKIDIAYREKPMADEVLGFFKNYTYKFRWNYFYISCKEDPYDNEPSCWDYGFSSDSNNEEYCISFLPIEKVNEASINRLINNVLIEFTRRQKLAESRNKIERLNRDFE